MAKSIQSFEAWGYVVDPNAEGYKGVEFTAGEKHCNIYHPDAVDATMPINTFSVTEDKGMLKIPRAFNQSPDYDRRPKHQKLKVRDQIVSYWSMVENRSLKDLKQIHYTTVIERNLRDRMEEVYEMKGADEFDELTLQPPEPAFQLLLTNTPFLAGVQKMLDEYANKFAGKTIQSCTFHPIVGCALYDFTITLTPNGGNVTSNRGPPDATLTPQLFREAHVAQWLRTTGKSWSLEGGYVDGVLDDRNPKYARYYPGQSKGLPYRVYHDHAKNIRNGSTHTLHYFVLARGHGHRHALFLRLWSTPSAPKGTKEADLNAIMQNLLEMTLCRAFESLPANILGDFFGHGTYSNVDLNNLPPLFQGRRVTATLRAKYAEYLRHSPDPDISAFVDIRRSQNATRRQPHDSSGSLPRTSSVLEYRDALEELIQSLDLDPDSFAHWTNLVSCTLSNRFETDITDALRKLASDDEKPFVGPIGSALAKLGVVLDSEFADVSCVENYAEPLKGFRLSMENSLIWTSSFEWPDAD